MLPTLILYLIACHGGPADHFAAFAEELRHKGIEVHICASGPALHKFQEKGLSVDLSFEADLPSREAQEGLASQISSACSHATLVLTDLGHPFDLLLHQALSKSKVRHFAYYDNPEPRVAGGYSEIAAKVMPTAQKVLFANSNLAREPLFLESGQSIELPLPRRIGVGYYPVHKAFEIAERRKDRKNARLHFLAKQGVAAEGKKVCVYFGANNEEYFSKSFPAFLSFIEVGAKTEDLSDVLFVLQQHPGAQKKNRDGEALLHWLKHQEKAPSILISSESSEDIQVIADCILYSQTSMAPNFALAGIPLAQVAHEKQDDLLVKNNICPALTSVKELTLFLKSACHVLSQEEARKKILKSLGLNENWLSILEQAIHGTAGLSN